MHFPASGNFPAARSNRTSRRRGRWSNRIADIDHQYPGRPPVHLVFFAVNIFEGIPEGRVFQQIVWVAPQDLSRFDFLEADRPLIEQIAAGKFSVHFW